MPYDANGKWTNDVAGWKTAPIYKINKYLQAELVSQGLIDLAKYSTLNPKTPIIPVQQSPDASALPTSVPFLVYNFMTPRSTVDFFNQVAGASWIVYTDNHDQGVSIMNMINNKLRREDETARDINEFNRTDTNNPFDFKWVMLNTSAAIQPQTEEGGRRGYLVAITFGYTDDRLFA